MYHSYNCYHSIIGAIVIIVLSIMTEEFVDCTYFFLINIMAYIVNIILLLTHKKAKN